VSAFSKAELSFIYIQHMQCREKKDYEICRKGAIKILIVNFFYFHLSFTIRKAATNTVAPWQCRLNSPKTRNIYRGFSYWKMKDDDQKSSPRHCNWFQIFSLHLCQSLYNVKKKPQLELCAFGNYRILIANYCTRWGCNFKGLSQDGESLLKISASLPFTRAFQMSLLLAWSI
jgi:hypothetical protein